MINNSDYWIVDFTQSMRIFNTIGSSLPKEDQLSNKRILDVGCNNGDCTIQLSFIYPNHQILGIDISEKSIEEAKKRQDNIISNIEKDKKILEEQKKRTITRLENVEFELGDGYELKNNELFSMIFFMNNILFVLQGHHIDNLKNIMGQINSKLENNGYLVFSANKEFFILQKDKKKYNLVTNFIQTKNLDEAKDEIIKALNNY